MAAGVHEMTGQGQIGPLTRLSVELDKRHLDHRMPLQAGVQIGAEGGDEMIGSPARHAEQVRVAHGAMRSDRRLDEVAVAVELVAHRLVLVAARGGPHRPAPRS